MTEESSLNIPESNNAGRKQRSLNIFSSERPRLFERVQLMVPKVRKKHLCQADFCDMNMSDPVPSCQPGPLLGMFGVGRHNLETESSTRQSAASSLPVKGCASVQKALLVFFSDFIHENRITLESNLAPVSSFPRLLLLLPPAAVKLPPFPPTPHTLDSCFN